MSNEIKVGDKVRVREDAPRMYLRTMSAKFLGAECGVFEIIDGNAAIASGRDYIAIPLKYLVKVDAEAKEAKFKVGDKVVRKNVSTVRTIISIDYVGDDEDPSYYYNTVDSQGNNPMDFVESELILYTESTPKYKKGDRVEELVSRKSGRVLGIEGDFVVVGIPYDKEKHYWHIDSVELIEPTEQTEAEKKPNVGSIKIPVEVDLTDSYWDAYAADLAKEIAVKVANKFNDPEQAAEYAVSVAKAVAEGLKRK